MPIEHEAKVLDIDTDAVTARILAAGGKQVAGTRLMRRHVYDIVPSDMSKWIRLRDTGTETTLCVKEIRSDAIDGTHEVETTVSDFAATNVLLGLLGFTEDQLTGENTIKVYARYGIDLSSIPELRFPSSSGHVISR